MDVTKLLEADHRTVEKLFDQIEKAQGEERQTLIDELRTNIDGHMQLEEQIVYPTIETVVGAEAIQEANTEHELARKAMADLLALAPDEPGFGAALEACKAGIEHHVEEEEGEVFPQLRKEGKELLAELATPFLHKRTELGLPMEASALASASTKDELLSEAQNAGLDATASMTKDELANALADAMR